MDSKPYNLEDRTLLLAKTTIRLLKRLSKTIINANLINQVSRSICSIGANYREVNDTDTKREKLFRLRISRKEAKESSFWLELLIEANPEFTTELTDIKNETEQLRRIINSVIEKSQ